MSAINFKYNGKTWIAEDHCSLGRDHRTFWYWNLWETENGKRTDFVRCHGIWNWKTEFPEIIDRHKNGNRKRYFVCYEEHDEAPIGNAYRLRWAYRNEIEGFERITRKEAEWLAKMENERRYGDPLALCGGYADNHIHNAYEDYLSIKEVI